jgi:hypothetical protein
VLPRGGSRCCHIRVANSKFRYRGRVRHSRPLYERHKWVDDRHSTFPIAVICGDIFIAVVNDSSGRSLAFHVASAKGRAPARQRDRLNGRCISEAAVGTARARTAATGRLLPLGQNKPPQSSKPTRSLGPCDRSNGNWTDVNTPGFRHKTVDPSLNTRWHN